MNSEIQKSDQTHVFPKITAPELVKLGVMDHIIPEPLGGAQRDHQGAAKTLRTAILKHLRELQAVPISRLVEQRYRKLRAIGKYREAALNEVKS